MEYNLLINSDETKIKKYISEIAKDKLAVFVFLYENEKDRMFLIYKLFSFNNNIDAVILCCKNDLFEILRLERIVKKSFNNYHIIIVQSCVCNKDRFGNIMVKNNPLNIFYNKQINRVGNTTITIFNKTNFKHNSYITKCENIKIINSIYNIIGSCHQATL